MVCAVGRQNRGTPTTERTNDVVSTNTAGTCYVSRAKLFLSAKLSSFRWRITLIPNNWAVLASNLYQEFSVSTYNGVMKLFITNSAAEQP